MSCSAKLYNKNYRAYEKKRLETNHSNLCNRSPKNNNWYPQEKISQPRQFTVTKRCLRGY